MADSTSPSDFNNFDNDFEKVEPLVSGLSDQSADDMQSMASGMADQFVSSSIPSTIADDIYSASENVQNPLLDFGISPEKPVAPAPAALSKPSEPVEIAKPMKPAAQADAWFKNIDPRVLELIYWRDPKKTGVVFGSMLVLLLSLACFSVLSVVAYLSLAALTVTVSFCIYKKVLQAVQKTGDGHPFKQYLDVDITVSEAKVHQAADIVVKRSTETARELRRLFMVEDLVDSLKFGLLLWVLTYLGAAFNGMTLIILALVSVFTIPKFYEVNKAQIDQYIELARTQVKQALKQVQEKLPLPGKKAKTN